MKPMRALAATVLLLCAPALAEPSARLLPKDAPPAALDFSGQRKAMLVAIATAAALSALALVIGVVLTSQQPYPDVARPPLR